MDKKEILEYNERCALFLGWEFFENSKTGIEGYPFGGHDGFKTTSVWIKNPTQKYIDNPCHYHYEYLEEGYNDDISQKDLFDDYAYSLKFDSDWNWIMEVVEAIEKLSENQNVISWARQNKCIFDLKLTESKKEAVIYAINQFLIWYYEHISNRTI